MNLSFYPTLMKAFNLMLADNVASSNLIKKISMKMSTINIEPTAIFVRAEADLLNLTMDELEMLCCGAQDDPACPFVTDDVSFVLEALFEFISPE